MRERQKARMSLDFRAWGRLHPFLRRKGSDMVRMGGIGILGIGILFLWDFWVSGAKDWEYEISF
jgi:hypothetical protein